MSEDQSTPPVGDPPKEEGAQNQTVLINWSGNSYPVNVGTSDTIGSLKVKLESMTGVLAKRQKIIGLKYKGRPAGDECALDDLGLKPNQKVMMLGTVEQAIACLMPPDEELPDVLDDFDYEYWPDLEEVRCQSENQAKLKDAMGRVKSITLINSLREGKKLCVLDLDYTLFDMKSTAPRMSDLKRPHLDAFLTRIHQHYDIAIWSQTSWRWLELKLTELGLLTNPAYSIAFVLDRTTMFEVGSKQRNGEMRRHEVKALAIIWNVFPQFGPHNTVHVDDLGRNFVMNPRNGIKVSAYKNYATSQHTDTELLLLAAFLEQISPVEDVTAIDFTTWKKSKARRML